MIADVKEKIENKKSQITATQDLVNSYNNKCSIWAIFLEHLACIGGAILLAGAATFTAGGMVAVVAVGVIAASAAHGGTAKVNVD